MDMTPPQVIVLRLNSSLRMSSVSFADFNVAARLYDHLSQKATGR